MQIKSEGKKKTTNFKLMSMLFTLSINLNLQFIEKNNKVMKINV